MIIHPESRSLLLRSRDPRAIQAILPHNKLVDYNGHNLAVRHGLDEVRVLRNLGIPAPSPILHYYDWPGRYTPFEHQRQTSAFLTLHARCFCLNEMGTAKTASALWAADFLMRERQIRRVLVVAPLSTLELVWMQEIFGVLMHRQAVMLHGSRERRIERLGQDVDFYVVNHDGVGTIARQLARREEIDLVIVDEAAAYRNAETSRYEMLAKVIGNRKLWLLSGTPCPNAPTDAWALARLVNKTRVPEYFGQWRRQTMMQINQYKWIPRADSYELAYRAMQPAIRFKKSECLDLPPTVTTQRVAELSDEQKKTYKTMKNRMVLESRGQQITAVHAADQINKLRQILCGAVRNTETGGFVMLDHAPRFEVLRESIEQASAKVVVVVPFKPIINELYQRLVKTWSVEIINGDVSRGQRTDIIRRFKNTPDPHILLCHPQVMSHGLNLVEADTIVFYAPIYSNELYQQVQERISRPGQTRSTTIVRIGAHPLEWEIYRMTDAKAIGQESILSLYRREVEGAI